MEKDLEKARSNGAPSQYAAEGSIEEAKPGTRTSRLIDSFRRNPNARVVQEATDAEGRPLKNQPPAEPALSMKLKDRHLQMIAIGGSIGMKQHGPNVIIQHPNLKYRHRSIRWFWCSSTVWRAGIIDHRVWAHRNHVVLHSPRSWRAGSCFPSSWIVCCLCLTIHRSCLGFCHGKYSLFQNRGLGLCSKLQKDVS